MVHGTNRADADYGSEMTHPRPSLLFSALDDGDSRWREDGCIGGGRGLDGRAGWMFACRRGWKKCMEGILLRLVSFAFVILPMAADFDVFVLATFWSPLAPNVTYEQAIGAKSVKYCRCNNHVVFLACVNGSISENPGCCPIFWQTAHPRRRNILLLITE